MFNPQYGLLETQIKENKIYKNIKSQVSTESSDVSGTQQKCESFSKNSSADIVWTNVIVFAVLHLSALHGIYLIVFEKKFLLLTLGKVSELFRK